VQEVRVEPDTAAGLTGAGLISPRAGMAPPSLLVRGWVLGAESRALAVEVVQGERVVRVAPVREPSPSIAETRPDRPEAAHCEFITRLHAVALEPEMPLVLRAALADGRRAGVATITLERQPAAPPKARGAAKQPQRPSLRDRIEQLVKEIGASHDVDPERLDPRMGSLEGVDLAGKRVLVLGSGAGQLARAARARGAEIVDGVEENERLLLLARLLNAYHGATRVSFSEAPPDPEDSYDMVLEP
jgi:hypothetical protein